MSFDPFTALLEIGKTAIKSFPMLRASKKESLGSKSWLTTGIWLGLTLRSNCCLVALIKPHAAK